MVADGSAAQRSAARRAAPELPKDADSLESLRRFVESRGAVLFVLSIDGRDRWIAPAWARLYGGDPARFAREPVGATLKDLYEEQLVERKPLAPPLSLGDRRRTVHHAKRVAQRNNAGTTTNNARYGFQPRRWFIT